ncbi:MAG: hypothetical protein HQL66_14640, partial [Magnetococcales bacterium]|nr:hypothetical protein [Magnetococcales bacterium]
RPPPTPEVDKKKTTTPASTLRLVGAVTTPRLAWAVLARRDTPHDQIVLHPGEKVDGATLTKIEHNAVYVDDQGRVERLEMTEAGGPGGMRGVVSARAKRRGANPPTTTPPPPPAPASQPTNPPITTGPSPTVASSHIARAEYEAMLAKGVAWLAGVVVTPWHREKELAGYQIDFSGQRADLKKIGLLPHDVIERIDGIAVTDTPKVTQWVNQLKNRSAVQVELLRDGQTLILNLQVDKS